MRETINLGRPVRLMVPVWHVAPFNQGSGKKLDYNRPMTVLELQPNTEYKCTELQALIDRGAEFASELDYTYVCSHGFVPDMGGVGPVSELTTGLDPEKELN